MNAIAITFNAAESAVGRNAAYPAFAGQRT